ncbi:MAG TPA: FAD-dependent oxidoreductase, partial [Bacilli bacterium]|nr:FAD-dependent oxidoreductase [Bacilli bacterium]
AANAHEANAATIGDVLTALILDIITPGSTSDRVLNGPTNDVWITPWLEHLRQNGVHYHLNAEVKAINCDGEKINSVTIAQDGETFDYTADYYVSAMPVEVMALLLNKELLQADPTLESIKDLAKSVDWMTGIQFYLKKDLSIVEGHIAYMDSPWALTSIFQKQFWPDFDLSEYGDGTVKDILSVDISDWHANGVYVHKKPAIECTKQEIMEEVWAQLKHAIVVDGNYVLEDADLHAWFLDPDIQFVNPHQSVNLEPLLINKVGTWDLRPNAYTRIPNFFLASDYVRTNTDLATMEGANEAARRAVNAILSASGSDEAPCKIWDMYEPELLALYRHHDRKRYEKGLPWDGKMFSFTN